MKSQRKPRAVQQDVTFLTDQFKKKSSAYEAIISPTTKVEMKTQDSFVRNSAWPPLEITDSAVLKAMTMTMSTFYKSPIHGPTQFSLGKGN